jgi:phosphoglycolate phosphatase
MVKLVIFDLDGTLINSNGDLKFCMNKMLEDYGLPKITTEETYQFVGYGARRFVELALKGNLDNFEERFLTFNKYLRTFSGDNAYIYEGLDELLLTLKEKGVKLAIVSNKQQDATDFVVNKMLGKYNFDVVCGIGGNFKTKPDTTAVEYVLKTLGVSKEETLYVGDSEIDMLTAINAGLKSVGVLWGFRTKEQLIEKGGKVFAETAKELYELIEKF